MISIVPPALSSPIFTGLGCQFVKRHTYCLRSGRRQIKRWPRELDPIIDQLLKVQKLRAHEFAGVAAVCEAIARTRASMFLALGLTSIMDGSQAHNRPNALGVPVVTRAEENMRVLEGGEGMALH